MTDALIEAIVAAPDDDAPRLVYADWLIERGDARGELIALQCRLGSSPEIAARAEQLRRDLQPVWLDPLFAIAPGGYELRRGFVEHAELLVSARTLGEQLEQLFSRAPLLRSIGMPAAAAHAIPTAMDRVTSLALHELGTDNDGAAASIAALPHLSQLRRLEITNGVLDDHTIAAFCDCSAPLEHLRLDTSFPYPQGRGFGDGDRAIARIAASPARSQLCTLVLAGFRLTSLRPLAALPRLIEVVLHDCEASGDVGFGLPANVRVTREPPAQTSNPTYLPGLANNLLAGNLIAAIKTYRELTGVGLAAAKTAVERIARLRA
ncbi:MAG TPA: TIGR02996 domain-containing protein [Kofleriaceae bacterium]